MAIEGKVSKALKEIAGTEYVKTIFPGLVEMQEEAGAQLVRNLTKRNEKFAVKNTAAKIAGVAMSGTDLYGTDAQVKLAKEIQKKLHPDTIEEDIGSVIEEYSKKYDNLKGRDPHRYKEVMYDRAFDADQAELAKDAEDSIVGKALAYPQAYFTHPDSKVRSTRIATAAGAYAALTVVWYYLTYKTKRF